MKMKNLQRQFALLAFVLTSALACAQPLPKLNNMTPAVALASPSMITPITPVNQPGAHPIEPFDIDDYNGPLSQVVARFSLRLESPPDHFPRHKSAVRPCALSASDNVPM